MAHKQNVSMNRFPNTSVERQEPVHPQSRYGPQFPTPACNQFAEQHVSLVLDARMYGMNGAVIQVLCNIFR